MQTIEDTIATKQGEALKRLDFWKASVLIFMDYPLGVGVKNFEKIVSFYDPNIKDRDAHNTYVLCYSEIGILGIFLFLIILGEAWLQLRRVDKIRMDKGQGRKKSLDVFALRIVYLIYLLGYMMTHSILYTEILWILLSMPICLENAVQKLLIMKTERRIKYTDRHMINGSVE
jgi:putative inorganic carbon (HCO3(-)) transporter